MTAALQHCRTAILGIAQYLAGEGIAPFVVHGRPVAIAEPPTIDVVAETHPVEVPPGRRTGRRRTDALEEQNPGNYRSIRLLAPVLT